MVSARSGLILCMALVGGCRGAESTDQALRWQFSKVWTIGGSGGGGVAIGRLYHEGIASDGLNRIYVVGNLEHRLFAFDSLGRLVATLGRQGSGPGEFGDPYGVTLDSAGDVGVVDLERREIVIWTPDGRLRDAPRITGSLFGGAKVALRGGEQWYMTMGATPSGMRDYELRAVSAQGSRTIAVLPRPPVRTGDFPACHRRDLSAEPLFVPLIQWDAIPDRVAFNAGPDYVIRVLRSDGRVDSVARAIPPVRATETLAEREAAGWTLGGCTEPPAEVVRVIGHADVVPTVRMVALSPDGHLWVARRNRAGEDTEIDVFDPRGAYLGTLPSGAPWPSAFVGPDRIVVLEKDSLDVPAVTMYRIARDTMAKRP